MLYRIPSNKDNLLIMYWRNMCIKIDIRASAPYGIACNKCGFYKALNLQNSKLAIINGDNIKVKLACYLGNSLGGSSSVLIHSLLHTVKL